MQIGVGFSSNNDHIKAAQEAFNEASSAINRRRPDLALLFNTLKLSHPLVLKTIRDSLGDTPLLGLSSPSIIVNRGSCKNGLAIALFSFPEDIYFNTTCVKEISLNNASSSGEKLGDDLLYGCKGIRRNLSIIFLDGQIPEGENIIFGMQKKVGRSFPMVGASTLGPVYFNNSILNNAACGILFGGKLNFGLGVKHGWQPLGKPRRVTLSSGNTAQEIDNKAAASLYQEYFAKDSSSLKKDLKHISPFYPLGIDISGKKEYLLRSLSSIGESGSLAFNGDIPQGSRIRLMISSKEYCLESTRQAAQLAKESLKNQKAKFILIFNSLARSMLLGRQENIEISAIKEVFGADVPILGAYTLAEEAPLNSTDYLGIPYYHNNSIAILAMAG